jgi:outer membrane receptor protein involved in Fe transport
MWGAEAAALAPLGARTSRCRRRSRGCAARATSRPEAGVVDPRPARAAAALGTARAALGARAAGSASSKGWPRAEQTRVDSGLQETATPAWQIANLRAGVELGRFWLIGGVENLFDRTYREHLSYQRDPFRAGVAVPEPGRSLSLTLRYRS